MPSYTRNVDLPGKSSQELYDKVSQDIERFLTKASIGKFEIDRDPGKRQVKVKSSMLTATLYCEDGKFRLEGSLSFLAAPFRGKIDEGIDRWLAKAFPKANA
jgi:hypothetical protein